MEKVINILKQVSHKLIDNNGKDDIQILSDIKKATEILSNHKCNNSEQLENIKLKESIKNLEKQNKILNMNNNDLKVKIDQLNCLIKELKSQIQQLQNVQVQKNKIYENVEKY